VSEKGSGLSREQIERIRSEIDAGQGRVNVPDFNGCYAMFPDIARALCDMALRYAEGRAGVIEECARVCDSLHDKNWKLYKTSSGQERASPYVEGLADGAGDCSEAIRALKSAPNEMAEMAEPEKLPPCMIPDGGDCCPQYDKLRREVEELRAELKIQDDANEILTRRLSDAGGTVRVPREPTMGQWDDFCAVHHVPFDKFIVAYKAMLSAAPSGGRNE
jgi:hypothetical protein